MMTIYDIVSGGEILLASDEEFELLITWNQSMTFNVYLARADGAWDAVDCRTLGDVPSLACASRYAERLIQEYREEE